MGRYFVAVIHELGDVYQSGFNFGLDFSENYDRALYQKRQHQQPCERATIRGMLAVGATHYWDTHTIADYSSRGPTPDGRVKPDIVSTACGQTASYLPRTNRIL